jgi:hypothetical protein
VVKNWATGGNTMVDGMEEADGGHMVRRCMVSVLVPRPAFT